MRLPVIDRYLLREILTTWAGVTLILVLILLTNSLAYMLGKVVDGEVMGRLVLPLFLTNVAGLVATIIPLGLYLALLLTFGRLYADSEMAALGACGVGMARLYRPVVIAGVVAALITASLTLWVSPWAKRVEHDVRAQLAERSSLAGVAPGRFNRAGDGDLVLFAASKDDQQRLQEVFIHGVDGDGRTHVIRAATARERQDADTGWGYLELIDGARYTGSPGGDQYRVVEFERHGIRLPDRDSDAGELALEGKTLAELNDTATSEAMAERQWRLAVPVSCLILALMALPISHTTPRKGRYSKLVVALLVYIVYANLLIWARDAVADGDVAAFPGIWLAHALGLVGAIGLIMHRSGWRWRAHLLVSTARGARS
jgi:lipopolysaccharide export system permease protein